MTGRPPASRWREPPIVGTVFGVWDVPYASGQRTPGAPPRKLVSVRTSGRAGNHVTTSVAFAKARSSRASARRATSAIRTRRDARSILRCGEGIATPPGTFATRSRSGESGHRNIVGGQRRSGRTSAGHPYEIFDAVTLQPGTPITVGRIATKTAAAPAAATIAHGRTARRVPAYATPIGVAFYRRRNRRTRFRRPIAAARSSPARFVAPATGRTARRLVPMNGDVPRTPVDWSDPNKQWHEFVGGFQRASSRAARPPASPSPTTAPSSQHPNPARITVRPAVVVILPRCALGPHRERRAQSPTHPATPAS